MALIDATRGAESLAPIVPPALESVSHVCVADAVQFMLCPLLLVSV